MPVWTSIDGRSVTSPMVIDPTTSTGVTTTAVNQHLRALARAGLLRTSRFGRCVLYQRTEVADALIEGSG